MVSNHWYFVTFLVIASALSSWSLPLPSLSNVALPPLHREVVQRRFSHLASTLARIVTRGRLKLFVKRGNWEKVALLNVTNVPVGKAICVAAQQGQESAVNHLLQGIHTIEEVHNAKLGVTLNSILKSLDHAISVHLSKIIHQNDLEQLYSLVAQNVVNVHEIVESAVLNNNYLVFKHFENDIDFNENGKTFLDSLIQTAASNDFFAVLKKLIVKHTGEWNEKTMRLVMDAAVRTEDWFLIKDLLLECSMDSLDPTTLKNIFLLAGKNHELCVFKMPIQNQISFNYFVHAALRFSDTNMIKEILPKYVDLLNENNLNFILQTLPVYFQNDLVFVNEFVQSISNDKLALIHGKSLEMMLHFAAGQGDLALVQEQLTRHGKLEDQPILIDLLDTAVMDKQLKVIQWLLPKIHALKNKMLANVLEVASFHGDVDFVDEFLREYRDFLDESVLMNCLFESMKSESGLLVTDYFIENHFDSWDEVLVLCLVSNQFHEANQILNLIKTRKLKLDAMKFYNFVMFHYQENETRRLNLIRYVFENVELYQGSQIVLYQAIYFGDKSAFDWILNNTNAFDNLDTVYAIHQVEFGINEMEELNLRFTQFQDRNHKGINETLFELYNEDVRQLNEKFTNIEFRNIYEIVFTVDQEKPLKEFYKLVKTLPDTFPRLLPPGELGIRNTFIRYNGSDAIDQGGVTLDFSSKSLSLLLSLDPQTSIASGDYPLEHALVKLNGDGIALADIFIQNMSTFGNQEILKNYHFLGRAIGYALNKNLASSSLDLQTSLIDAILGNEMNLKNIVQDNSILLMKLKSIVRKELIEAYDDHIVLFNSKVIENGKLGDVSIGLNKKGEFVLMDVDTMEMKDLLQYDMKSQNDTFIDDEDFIAMFNQLSLQNRKIFELEARAYYDTLHYSQLEQLREGLFSVIPKDEIIQRFPNTHSIKNALAGEPGLLTDLGWRQRTHLMSFENGTKVAEWIQDWFWEYMNQQSAGKQEEWLQVVTGQSRFHPGNNTIMTLNILPVFLMNGVITCRMSAHTWYVLYEMQMIE